MLDTLRSVSHERDVDLEVVVVDNGSDDGSAAAVRRHFPHFQVVELGANLGFGRANNAGLEQCRGELVLLLNPDVTVVPGCVGRLAGFLGCRPEAGAVGPRLQRPDGGLDPAAMRGFPTPSAAFYRLTGLSRLFRRSARFNRYNLGHLDPTRENQIDAGTAACLMVRRAALDEAGPFDPDFFMYGEDLDLCYRLHQAGWSIHYLPEAVAVHVKGASSRQATGRMLYEFHRAMWTFHRKHNAGRLPAPANALVWSAIWARWALLAGRARLTGDRRVSL